MSLNIELIKACLSSIRDALIVIDDQGVIEYWNFRAEQIFGYTAEEVRGQDLQRLIAPEHYRAYFQDATQRFAGTPEAIDLSVEVEGFRRDGRRFPSELSLTGFQSEGRWHSVAILRDISELADAQRRLRGKERWKMAIDTINSQAFHNQTLEQILTTALIQICSSAGESFRQQGAIFVLDRAQTLRLHAAYNLSSAQQQQAMRSAAKHCPCEQSLSLAVVKAPQRQEENSGCGLLGEECPHYCFPMVDRKARHLGVLVIAIDEQSEISEEMILRLQQLVNCVALLIERYSLYEQNSHLRQIIKQSPIAIAITDPQARFEYVNPQFCASSGYSRDEVIGKTPQLISSAETSIELYTEMWATITQGGQWRGEIRNRKKNGELFWESEIIWPVYSDAKLVSYVMLKEDITAKKYYQAQLESLSTHDTLTGLPNEQLLRDRIRQQIAKTERNGQPSLLCAIDIKQMRLVNEGLGLAIGDALLKEISARLKTLFRKADTLARLSGDTFVLICCSDKIAAIGAKIEALCADPFITPAADIPVEVYCSILELPHSSNDTETILRRLTATLHRAKAKGSRAPVVYDSSFDTEALQAFSLTYDLSLALARSQFQMWYQPKVNILSGRVVGAEALIRWCHPVRGLVSPLEFIGQAESSGQIIEIGRWVIREVIRQIGEWADSGQFSHPVSLNVSARQLSDPQLLQTIRESLTTYRVDPGRVELELTESVLAVDPLAVRKILNDFASLGLKIALDDFGTGYSSLAYISKLPIHTVKIDQSFVQGICQDPQDAVIVKSTLSMCRDLGINTIAEGVETEAQGRFMSRHGCQQIQGYLFSKPLPPAEFSAIAKRGFAPLDRSAESDDVVIILDDEQSILNAIQRGLYSSHYKVLLTRSPEQALEWLASYDVGVVVSDQRMAAISGVEFLRKIKTAYPETCRIILSGYSDLKTVTQAINEGSVFRFLSKPWEDEDLKNSIDEGFHYYNLRRSLLKKERLLDRIQKSSHLDPADYLMGISPIDAEHAQLFRIHNRLSDAFFAHADRAEISALYQEFTDASRQHFEIEERLMTATAYPAAKAHRQEHAALLARFAELGDRLSNEHESVNQYELICFLKNYLMIHIREYDLPIASHLQQEQPGQAV